MSSKLDHCFLFSEIPVLVGSITASCSKNCRICTQQNGDFAYAYRSFSRDTLQSTSSLHRQILTKAWDSSSTWFYKLLYIVEDMNISMSLCDKITTIHCPLFVFALFSGLLHLFGTPCQLFGFKLRG